MHYCHNWKQVVQSWCFRELFIYFLNQSIHPFISLCLSAVGSWGQQPLTRFIRESPAALETQFAYPWSCCCSQYPKLMTVGERRNVDRELRLWLSSLPQHTGTASASLQTLHWSTCRSPAPSFPHLWTQFRDTSNPPLGAGRLTLFWLKTMVMEALT